MIGKDNIISGSVKTDNTTEPSLDDIDLKKGLAGQEVLSKADISIVSRLMKLIKIRKVEPTMDCSCSNSNGLLDDVCVGILGVAALVLVSCVACCWCKNKK